MRSKLIFSLLAILLLAQIQAVEIGANVDTVRILSVSTEIDTESASRMGSIEGGTRLYIKMVGHDSHIPSNNVITVGDFNCDIPDMGVNEVFITCITTAATPDQAEIPLDVVVNVAEHSPSQCAQNNANLCKFTYKASSTPILEQIIPRTSSSNSRLTWEGYWRISNTNQILKMLIGDQICDRFFKGLNEDESYSGSSRGDLECDVGQLTVGGYYNSNFLSKPGTARKPSQLTTSRSSKLEQTYDFQIVPNITSISHSQATSSGAILSISAFGLPDEASNVQVSYNNQDCKVLSLTPISKNLLCQISGPLSNPSSSNQYKSGSGVRLQSFSTSTWSLENVISDYHLDPTKRVNTLLEDKIIATTEVYVSHDSSDGASYPRLAVVLSGYFTPKTSGIYYFQTASSYQSKFYIQLSGSSTTFSTMKLLTQTIEGTNLRNPYSQKFGDQTTVSEGVNLTANQNYYFESYGLSNSNTYFFLSNGVRVPISSTDSFINSSGQVSQISIDYDFTKEVISISHQDLLNTKLGYFKIYFIAPYGASSSAKATYWSTPSTQFTKNSLCSDLSNHFQWYLQNVRSTCVKTDILDSNSKLIGATWTLTFKQHRSQVKPTFSYDQTLSSKPVFTVLTEAGQNLSGAFKIQLNGDDIKLNSSTNIAYNTPAWSLQDALRATLKTKDISVTSVGNAEDGFTYYLDFYGVYSEVPLTVSQGTLSGEAKKNIAISVTNLRIPDGTLNFITIENDLLSQLQSSPAVTLTVNDSQAICVAKSNCILTVLDDQSAPSYTSFSDDETAQQITISGLTPASGSTSVTKNSFNVVFNNQVLQVISYSNGSLVAQYKNKIAGSYKPIVDQVGYGVALSNGVNEVIVLPQILSLSTSSIYSFGGTTIVISGKYFPNSLSGLSVKIDGVESIIQKVSNTSITIFSPTLATTGQKNIVVTYLSQSSSPFAITVDNSNAITITGISTKTPSPISKTKVTVQGTNFGTNKSDLTAYLDLYNDDGTIKTLNAYSLNVVKADGNSAILLFGGGKAGNYRLRIVQIGFGSNNPNANGFDQITYIIKVTSLSRTTSSKYGGSSLVINGQNFSGTKADNSVLIVYSPSASEICTIVEAQSTQLTCILPDMSSHMGSQQSVSFSLEVWGLLLVQATSSQQLSITFSNSITPQVTSLSSSSGLAGSTINILGSSLSTNIADLTVFFLNLESTPATVISSTGTSVTVKLPFVEYSTSYQLVLKTVDGNSAPQTFTLQQGVISSSSNTTPVGGKEITLTLSGLSSSIEPIFQFNSLSAEVLSYTAASGTVKLRLPSTSAGSYPLKFARSSSLQLNSDGTYPWQTYSTKYSVTSAVINVNSQVSISGSTVTVTGTGLNVLDSAYLQVANSPKSDKYASSSLSSTASSASISFNTAPAGKYRIYLLDSSQGYASFTQLSFSSVTIELPQTLTAAGSLTSSYAGGQTFTITGTNFNSVTLSSNVVKVCGNEATVTSATATQLTLSTPPAYTTYSISTYSLASSMSELTGFTTFGDDSSSNSSILSDGDLLFYYDSTSSSEQCQVGIDFGSSTQVILDHFELFPRSQGVADASSLFGSVFQGSNDQSTWTNIATIGTEFHLGKNLFLIDTLISEGASSSVKNSFRFFRLYNSSSKSGCQLVELNVYGWKSSSAVESSQVLSCSISVSVNGSTEQVLSNKIQYDQSATYFLKSISPNYGQIGGGTVVTLTLDKNLAGAITVDIDGVQCSNPISTANTITCTTGQKSTNVASSLVITANGQNVITNNKIFYYGYLWSDDLTWGGDFAPIDGDLVYVNGNKILIVDVPYVGVLNTVIVENATIIFANDKDIHFEAHNIIVRYGNVIIGTEDSPITSKVVITMHGEMKDTQFPTIGNKGLSIYNGSLSIQGQTRAVTWTELSETAEIGASTIKVFKKDAGFNWQKGDEIVIASTDFSHGHAERATIMDYSISGSIVTIKISPSLNARHVSLSETYNGKTVEMRAEVGLLTRNVIFEGDDSSVNTSYGAHIMLHGAQTKASIKYAEFRHTGQPKIIGRYPIHFHMVGDVTGSIVEGNAVHDSFARVLTIHATHYLHVKNNVGYNCAGHNIFLEDGIETNNIIESNLILGTKQVWSMLQSDITCASYWITNPLNTVINNRAGGSDFYGFWYEIKENPDGPSARSDICPQGMALGKFQGNKAHSNDRFGLRIFVLNHLQYPCQDYRNDSKENPFEDNQSYTITWSDFVSYRNHEDGVLAEEIGNMVFDNFFLVDNKQSGFNVYLTNRTDQEVILRNSVIVGKSLGNHATDGELDLTRGLITPRTDGFRVENVHFANFDGTMTVFKSVSFGWHFKKWVTGGKLTRFKNISYENINSKMIFWENWKREIYEDIDGTLTKNSSPRWVTPNGPHLSSCTPSTDWDDGAICSKQVVRVEFSNPERLDEFTSTALFVQKADSSGVTEGGSDPSKYYISKAVLIKNHGRDLKNGFAGTFEVGSIYSVQWQLTGVDFTHMSVQLSPYHTGELSTDTIVLKFPYSDYRETFEVGKMIANTIPSFYQNATSALTDQQSATAFSQLLGGSCNHGDWFNNVQTSAFYLCLNSKGRAQSTPNQKLERTDVNALACKINCPLPPGQCLKDTVSRQLSNPSTWQNILDTGVTYNQNGETTLTIPCPWTLVVDTDLKGFEKIIVQGTLKIDPTKDINISAYGIWIKGGTIVAQGATDGSPYTKKLNILLLGVRTTPTQFLIADDIQVGNKVIANTGTFKLIGNPPGTTATRLTVPLQVGQNVIQVENATDWAVGDQIAIAPTQLSGTEDEQFEISSISGKSITLKSNAQYYHYGASGVTLNESWSDGNKISLDLRAQVLHLTRNIQISGEKSTSTANQWGCRILNYNWIVESDANGTPLDASKQTHMKGILNWDGVETNNCGQADTIRGAIDFNLATSDETKTVSVVKNSAIHNCPGICVNIDASADITLTNNNIYNSRPISLRIFDGKNLIIQNNKLVAARVRDYVYDTTGMVYDFTGHIYFYSQTDILQNNILITNNIAQGSQGPCLVFPHAQCSDSSNFSTTVGIFDNAASTCLVGAMFNMIGDGSSCLWAGRIAVARSERGIMVNPTTNGIIVENVLAAENIRSVILRFAHEAVDNTGIFQNSSIFGVAITNDPTAYDSDAKANVCKNNIGTQNLVVTRGGEMFPLKVEPTGFDVVCNSEVFDSHLHQVNLKYYNFQSVYTNNLAKCASNFMMGTHPGASDATAGTYNINVTCQNCDPSAYFLFRSPNPSNLGWFGGCGLFQCTGTENVLNIDFTGSLFSDVPSTAISHNKGIASSCTLQSNWNQAYQCPGTNYIQLEWESQASDFNKRSTAPVYLTDGKGYSNKINMYREWVWDGNEPMNLRENRFVATAQSGSLYTIEYNGLNPYNIIHKIQRRTQDITGEKQLWVVLNQVYQIPQNIEISVDGTVVDSYLPSDKVDLTTKVSICGANIYNYETRTVQFVVNGDASCIVRAKVLDTLRIHIKVVISSANFFDNDGSTKFSFLSKIAVLLKVDASQIKVVGASSNSGRFLTTGTPELALVIDITQKSSTSTPAQTYSQFNSYSNTLQSGLASINFGYSASFVSSSVMVSTDGNGGIFGASTATPTEQSQSSGSDSTLAIVLGVVIALIVVFIGIVSFCAYKRYVQRKHLIALQSNDGESASGDVKQSNKECAKVVPLNIDPTVVKATAAINPSIFEKNSQEPVQIDNSDPAADKLN